MTQHTPQASLSTPPRRRGLQRPLSPSVLYTPFASARDDWQDVLDRDLPAEPLELGHHGREHTARAHKLMLTGIALGAGAMTLGYLGAAWVF